MKAGAPRPPELDQPPFPNTQGRLVGWLFELPCPIQWPDLLAWQQATGRDLVRWEIDFLMALDRVRRQ